MLHDYEQEIQKCRDMIQIDIPEFKIREIDSFSTEVIKQKNEPHYKADNSQLFKRFQTGIMGECAVEQFLGIEFVDWSIGESRIYNTADLKKIGVNIGVKTVEKEKFHVISKTIVRPEIICIRDQNTIFLCGIASVSTLKKYQDDDLILSPFLRQRDTKTGFFGYGQLLPMSDLKEYIKKREQKTS